MKKAITSFLFALTLAFPARAIATEIPSFPSCSNPSGTLSVSYDSGVHGIVGNPGEFSGSDKVYTINETQTLQCFCSTNGDGIQTNWWRVSSLSQDQIQELKNLGWVFVPNGEAWGLSHDAYMAINGNFSCITNSNNGGGSSSSGSVSSSAASTVSDPSVLGLATTGDAKDIVILTVLSTTSLSLGIASRLRKK